MKKSKKRVSCLLLGFLMAALLMVVPGMGMEAEAAANRPDLLVDMEDLLDETEEELVREELEKVSNQYDFDVVIVTVSDFGGKTSSEYADDFFDYQGYGRGSNFDGILLLVSEGQREWAISTTGYGIYAFTDAGQSYMTDNFLFYLSDGDYYFGFLEFADLCDIFLEQAATGVPYDGDNMPKSPFSVMWVLIALFIGLIVALIGTAVLKSGMKSVHRQTVAGDYVVKGSLRITDDHELFLYRKLTRTARPKETSSGGGTRSGSRTHVSSSGRTHGGSSGRF